MNLHKLAEQIAKDAQQATLQNIRYRNSSSHIKESLSFKDVTIEPTFLSAYWSRKNVDLTENFTNTGGKPINSYPMFGASMSFMRKQFAHNLANAGGVHIYPRVGVTEPERLQIAKEFKNQGKNIGIAIGVNSSDKFLLKLVNLRPTFISIDIAHGASLPSVLLMLRLRELGLKSGLIVGNVGSHIGAEFIRNVAIQLGYKNIIIKLGVGPGAACTTREATGVGVGQVSLIYNTSRWFEFINNPDILDIKLIADGGIEAPADFVKALAAGAHGVMMGKMFANVIDFEVPILKSDSGETYLRYHGMASAAEKSENDGYIEGDIVLVKPKASSTKDAVQSLKFGLASAMSYVNAQTLDEFRKNVRFLRTTEHSIHEGKSRSDE